ncbi:hypothetical protein NL676_026706 [Syzygium grande]|nr:hypothetical protein NL676_026706 [Syzygium grande]
MSGKSVGNWDGDDNRGWPERYERIKTENDTLREPVYVKTPMLVQQRNGNSQVRGGGGGETKEEFSAEMTQMMRSAVTTRVFDFFKLTIGWSRQAAPIPLTPQNEWASFLCRGVIPLSRKLCSSPTLAV